MNIDLTTKIGSLELPSPIIAGSCPMTADEMQLISMVSNGVGAIVLPSFDVCRNEAPQLYLNQLSRIKDQISVPVFASLRTDLSVGDWFDLPAKLEKAGASAIELSLDGYHSGILDPRQREDDLVELAQLADKDIDIPLILKLTRSFTSISDLARRLRPYAQGVVMFGRTPVVDLELDSMTFSKSWGLTAPGSIVGSLSSIVRTKTDFPEMPLIACGGIASSEDLIKVMVAGASAAMVTSALYRTGTTTLGVLKDGLAKFMSDHGASNLEELRSLCPIMDDSVTVADAGYDKSSGQAENDQDTNQERVIQCDRFGHPVI